MAVNCDAPMIGRKHPCNGSLPLAPYLCKSSKSYCGLRRRWTRYVCWPNLNSYKKRVFRHAVTPTSEQPEALTPLRFSVQQCTEEPVPADGLPHTPPSL